MKVLNFVLVFVQILICVTSVSSVEESIIPYDLFYKLAKFYSLSSNGDLNGTCGEQTAEYFLGLTADPPELWAYTMLDASSKIQSGIMSGNFRDLGAFDQCLSIDVVSNNVSIRGKHCYATLSFNLKESKNKRSFTKQEQNFIALIKLVAPSEKTGNTQAAKLFDVKWSMCVPDACAAKQIQQYVQENILRDSIISFKLDESNCQSAVTIKPKLRSGDWVFIGFIIAILAFLVSSTVYDIYLQKTETEAFHPILLAFSALTNGKRLIAISNNSEQLPCLHGMRWFSMMWVILSHRYTLSASEPNVNTLYLFEWQRKFLSQLQFGSTVSVDTFFLLSGCLLMYGFLKAMTKKIPFNIPLFYLHRYLRLTPILAVIIAFQVTVAQYLGSGPRWPATIQKQKVNCEEHWWKVLLYIQNYEVDYKKEPEIDCVGNAWYLAIDMQLYWISPLILLPVWYYKRFAWPILTTLVAIFTVVPTFLAYHYKLTMWGKTEIDYNGYYTQTHGRAGTWLVGLCLGYALFYTRGKNITIKMLTSTVLWILSTIVALYVVFALYPTMQEGYEYQLWFSTIFIGFHRVAWCISLSWVIFACVHGYGGPANWFLSLPMFQVLGRFTYSMFLIHEALHSMRSGVVRSPGHFSNLDVWYIYWGDLFFSLIISAVCVLAFEYPIGVIDNVLLGGAKKPKVPTVSPSAQITPPHAGYNEQTLENTNEIIEKNILPPSISARKENVPIDMSTSNENLAFLQPSSDQQ